jgi:hypothetical protein
MVVAVFQRAQDLPTLRRIIPHPFNLPHNGMANRRQALLS